MKFNTIVFEDWFEIDLPEKWELEEEEDLLTFYDTVDGRGALQISCFNIVEQRAADEIAMEHLNDVIEQFEININRNTKKIIETPYSTIALTAGTSPEKDFVKIWIIVLKNRMLLCTYISDQKSRELSTAEDIIYSIQPA
ncbi:DUF3805 domain-containing protein [Fictibacillus aquaticus]|nr:DUF3805 domain-containing protein [Fictibacillus aquaticus]